MNPNDYLDYQQILIARRREALWRQLGRHKAQRDRELYEPLAPIECPQGKRPEQIGFSLLVLAFACLTGAGLAFGVAVATVANWMGWIKL